MQELLRTNDLVLISFVEAILGEAKIVHIVADQHTSMIEGSIGAIPRRILVDDDDFNQARRLLKDADLGAHLCDPPKNAGAG
ncbi:MAG: DUF2007 domain-containing protein [Pseudomonadota bacterium]